MNTFAIILSGNPLIKKPTQMLKREKSWGKVWVKYLWYNNFGISSTFCLRIQVNDFIDNYGLIKLMLVQETEKNRVIKRQKEEKRERSFGSKLNCAK